MRTCISYYGGKQNLAPEVISLFPEHIQYVEPFLGGGAVFFQKAISFNEVINDLNGWVTNFYFVVQTKYDQLEPLIKGTLHSEIHHLRAADILRQGGGIRRRDCVGLLGSDKYVFRQQNVFGVRLLGTREPCSGNAKQAGRIFNRLLPEARASRDLSAGCRRTH